jgi:hypothetical protein
LSARFATLLFVTLMFLGGCAARRTSQRITPPDAGQLPARPEARWSQEELAKSDSLEFLKTCRQRYLDNVRDYRCKFKMREAAGGGLSDQQVIAIKFRENPYSVDMTWLENSAGAKRISYVEDRWVKEGRQLAMVVPSGLGGIVVPGGIKLDIHGREFARSSSRSIDQFGFRKTLERAIRLCEEAKGDPAFSLRYAGREDFEGRPQYILERRLPYSEGGTTFPDRLAIFFVDAEWLTPTAVWSYADEQKQRALGEFITTDVEFNVGLNDADFE